MAGLDNEGGSERSTLLCRLVIATIVVSALGTIPIVESLQVNASTGPTSSNATIAAGSTHSLALKSDGTVWGWGNNSSLQLGAKQGEVITPEPIASISGVIAIAAGGDQSMALKSDGTVWVWGFVYHLYGGSVTTATPTQAPGLNGVTAIAAGLDQYVALKSDGTVWGWGFMYLGNGYYGGSDSPAQIMSGVVSISAGGSHNLAVKSDGTVWAWGSNFKGQLGDGSTTNSMTPVQVKDLSGVAAAAGGGADDGFSLALKTDGTVYTWGSNPYGQLGDGTTADRSTAALVPGVSGASAIAAGEGQSLALVGGAVSAWGLNVNGQLGDGSTTNRSSPVSVAGLGGVTAISGGGAHTLALKSDGSRWSWGVNGNRELANGSTVSSSSPVQTDPLVLQPATCGFKSVSNISGGAKHSIALKPDGTAWAWGDNSRGELGNTTTTNSSRPSKVSLGHVTAVAAGGDDSVALTDDGKVWVWGDNGQYALGMDNVQTPYSSTPLQVAGIPAMTAIATNGATTFALSSDGTVWGWGYSFSGALGSNTPSPWSPPIQIQYVTGVATITSGPVALRADGTVMQWGQPVTGGSPVGLDSVTAIAYRGGHKLAVRCDGSVWAWGDNSYGQLGIGNTTPVSGVQRTLNSPSFAGVSGGAFHSLALNVDGSMRSWGLNTHGQLGDATTTSRTSPVPVSGVSNIVAIAGGDCHSLAVRSDGTVVSWGCNDAGQLGNGTTIDSSTPSDSLMTGVRLSGPTITELYGGSNPSEKQCSCNTTKYPVNDATGNFFHTFADISIPGRGLPLSFQRTYNALAASQSGPFGYGWTFSYGSSLTLSNGNATITQENGSTVTFTNVGGVYTPPTRVLATLIGNSDGTYTFKRQDQTKYQFSATGQLIQESDRNGYPTNITYPLGQEVITDPGGRTLTLTYTGTLVTGLASSTGRSVSYQYDGSGNLWHVTDVNNGLTQFTYYPDHTMHTMIDANNGVMTNVYDGSGRVTSQTDPMQRLTTFDYSTPGQTKITDPKRNVTVEVYANNLLMFRTLGYGTPQAATWQYTYDPATLGVASILDPNHHTVRNTWDGNGNLLTHTDGLSRPTTYTYDSLNDVLTVKDPLGVPTINTYDAAGNLKSTSRTVTTTPSTRSAVSTSQYTLANSDGVTWQEIDSTNLRVTASPSANQSTLVSANSDLWTANAGGFNQDLGIFVSDNGGVDTLLAWKESGGFAGTFSPNAVYAQHLYNMTAGHSYVFKLKWKTNKNASGATIWAGAGSPPTFSPTSLTAEIFPFGLTPNFAISTSQYTLSNSDGATWQPIDASNLTTSLSSAGGGTAVLGANADLFTGNAGYNQDLGIFVSDNGGADTLVAWKESGGFAGTYSPNAAFVKATYALTGGHSYAFKLKWKTNKPASGATIYAAAGGPARFSPTSLFAQYVPTGANPYSSVSTSQYSLNGSDGVTWQPMDSALNVSVSPSADTNSVVSANADLWTDTAGYNQDIGIFVSDNGGADTLVAWKESGGFAGTFSPNAAFAQAVYPTAAGHSYVFKLKWKANKLASGATIYAAAGGTAPFSPTRLAVELTSRPLVGINQTATVTYQYTDAAHPGDVTAMIDPDTKTWQYGYDQYGDKNLVMDPLGDRTTYTFNADGWVQTKVSPNGYAIGPTSSYTTTYDYTDQRLGGGHINGFGDVGFTKDPLSRITTFTYDANRNLTFSTDANQHTTHKRYSFDNELTEVDRADGSKVKTEYDSDGNVWRQIDGLTNTTIYTYDPLNHPSSVEDPLSRTTNYVYDAVGNQQTVADPQNQTTTYAYDASDELTSITYSDGKTPNVGPIHYDLDGQRQDMTDITGKTTYSFDSLHRLTRQTNGAGSQVSYGYDLRGHVNSITYPGGANTVTRVYDDAGRLHTVTDWLAAHNTTQFDYDANGNLQTITYPNQVKALYGDVVNHKYDAADQLPGIVDTHVVNGNTTIFASYNYSRDNLGQLQGDGTNTYNNDAINRLTTVNGTPTAYGYDAADEITKTPSLSTTPTSYDAANELVSGTLGGAPLTAAYDARGNRTSTTVGTSTTTYGFDQANRMLNINGAASYGYNGDGLRMSKGSTQFTWDIAEGLPLIIQDGAANYITGPGGLAIEQVNSAQQAYFLQQDQLGSTRWITDTFGTIQSAFDYDPYGKITGGYTNVNTPFRFAGQYQDSESGLYYLRARYYDQNTGQFMSRDPAVGTTREPYAYTADNPLNRTDPSGLDPRYIDAALVDPYDMMGRRLCGDGGSDVGLTLPSTVSDSGGSDGVPGIPPYQRRFDPHQPFLGVTPRVAEYVGPDLAAFGGVGDAVYGSILVTALTIDTITAFDRMTHNSGSLRDPNAGGGF